MTYDTFQPAASPADPSRAVVLRLAAWLIDLALYVLVSFLTFLLLAERTEVTGSIFGSTFCERVRRTESFSECFEVNGTAWYTTGGRTLAHGALLLVWFLVVHVILQGLTGGSLGKLVTGVRVVREDGHRPGVGRALVRGLLWVVDGLPCCAPLVGLITMLATGRKQRVGDLVARTFVVRSADRGRAVRPAGATSAPTHPGPGSYPTPYGYPPAPGHSAGPASPAASQGPQAHPPGLGYPTPPQIHTPPPQGQRPSPRGQPPG
ncbi:MAG: hypothetical protein AVDCRST_MAG76-1681 [uncultured Acidimicrobiales bacterium]|uniref:RDD domain-containing protein n=1 Tax=uncultured Acidimicrobiales bacterium TaxID=310071 RepID=A0A6J4I1V1_9ACTN|nr:MAG: hypothetical protein AVDCRST_MAG76-1681 [uncultured Acidimicrobiales bacterium]